MINIIKYSFEKRQEWDSFVTNSNCPSFLFYRGYMDYHSDRFEDYSLLIYSDENLVAMLPANQVDDRVISHQGLTYGGLLLFKKHHYPDILVYLNSINIYLKSNGITKLTIKTPPYFYADNLAQELSLLLLRNSHVETQTVLGAAISTKDFSFPKMSLSKTKLKLFKMEESLDFKTFWNILEDNLNARYSASPVHNSSEIESLAKQFPRNIKLYTFRHIERNTIDAGVLLFINHGVVKTQYISSTQEGRKDRVSDALYYSVINTFKDQYTFIDFGTCEEENNTINMSLLNAKEKFGANSFPIFTYSFSTDKTFEL